MHLLQVDSFIFNCRPSNVDVKAFGGNGFRRFKVHMWFDELVQSENEVRAIQRK